MIFYHPPPTTTTNNIFIIIIIIILLLLKCGFTFELVAIWEVSFKLQNIIWNIWELIKLWIYIFLTIGNQHYACWWSSTIGY